MAYGKVSELIHAGEMPSTEIILESVGGEATAKVRRLADRVTNHGDRFLCRISIEDQMAHLLDFVRESTASLILVTLEKGSLEELFLKQVNKPREENREQMPTYEGVR